MENTWSGIAAVIQILFDWFYYLGSFWNEALQEIVLIAAVAIFLYHIHKLRKDKSLWADILRWMSSSIGAVFILLICLYMSPEVFPVEDKYSLWRYLILRITSFSFGIIALSGGMLFLDAITKGDWLGHVEQAEYGPTILLSVVILSLALLLIYV